MHIINLLRYVVIINIVILVGCSKPVNSDIQESVRVPIEQTEDDIKDYVRECLEEKYNEQFICEIETYYIETSQMHRIMAYPKEHPEIRFEVEIDRGIFQSYYYNELYKDEINKYFEDILKKYSLTGKVEVRVADPVETAEIGDNSFKENRIIISVNDNEDQNFQDERLYEIMQEIYNQTMCAGVEIYMDKNKGKVTTVFFRYEDGELGMYIIDDEIGMRKRVVQYVMN